MTDATKSFFAQQAWVNGTWARDVLLGVNVNGVWSGVQAGASEVERRGAVVLPGPVLPGLVNAHSHAFQRAIVGLTERRGGAVGTASDDFWSWRDRMYTAALRIAPAQLETIATLLYTELRQSGYTQVCEFHYLHNAPSGQPYADPLEMSLALARAAQRAGMGLTLLPTLYMRSGFDAAGLRGDQRRFASSPTSIARLVEGLQAQVRDMPWVNVGVAMHSLRAADEGAIAEIAAFANESGLPVHIHIAEQTQEVQDCISHTGLRPIEWLLTKMPVNANWNLVHATHTTPAELQGVAYAGASIIICPSTEANLGDGVFDYSGFAKRGGRWSIGSDSHVTRSWSEELRLLEYSQRLALRQRNVAAQAGEHLSTAAALFEGALAGGHAATAQPLGGIQVGHRADFMVLDSNAPALLGMPADHVLDAQLFSSPDAKPLAVYLAGQAHNLAQWPAQAQNYAQVMRDLWSEL
ncbi:formimidoylglutamate deiminase [Rhodoferax sp. PAMC 29310]|uniref:formimidoylglutamate deiminase n=1 Tax=Rhodoferax sp. PAMC 29310 TaxID=2822760 RepID=UPI001B339168|nr:formimidoylglutamate deiminase [Rhodoferax sp. PAMC 29310]